MHPGRLNNFFALRTQPARQLLDLLTLGLWSKLGKLVHYGVDAILSTCPPSPSLLCCSEVYIYTIANHGFVTPNSLDDPRRHAPLNRPDVSLVIYHTLPTNSERNTKQPPTNLSTAIYWALSRAPDNDGPSHRISCPPQKNQRGNETKKKKKKKKGEANTSPRPIGDLPGPA